VCEVFDLHAWFEFGLCVLVCCECRSGVLGAEL